MVDGHDSAAQRRMEREDFLRRARRVPGVERFDAALRRAHGAHDVDDVAQSFDLSRKHYLRGLARVVRLHAQRHQRRERRGAVVQRVRDAAQHALHVAVPLHARGLAQLRDGVVARWRVFQET